LSGVGARGADAGLELIEQIGVVMVDCIDEAGDQDIGLDVGFGKEAADQVRGAAAFEVARGKRGGVDEGAVLFVACEETFTKEAVKGGHDGGVGEAVVEVVGDLLDSGAAALVEEREHFALTAAEPAEGGERGAVFRGRPGCRLRFGHAEQFGRWLRS